MNDEYGNQPAGTPGSDWTALEKDHIINSIKSGNRQVFRQLFETYYNPMLRFAFRYVKCKVTAEGIVQNVFLWIWENRKKWNVEGKMKTYLFRSVKYKSVDHLRHERVRDDYKNKFFNEREEPVPEDIPFEFEEEENEFVCTAQQAIEELPDRPRMVYKMSRLEGLTYSEIAEILEVSPKTVETHMSRALSMLRKRLARFLPAILLWGNFM